MNKKQRIALIIILIFSFIFGFIESFNIYIPFYQDSLKEKYPEIVAHSWERNTDADTETIYFTDKGEFGYYCACGNAVDDYDLCDSYKFDRKTNTIKLKCLPGVDITKIKVDEVTKNKIVLDFNGEKREFITEYKHLIDNPLSFAGIKFKTPGAKEEIVIEFTKDGNFEAYNKTKGKYALGSEICFTWEYDEEKKEITLDCQDHKRKIKINKYNPTSNEENYPTELELYFEHEDKTYYFTNIRDNK